MSAADRHGQGHVGGVAAPDIAAVLGSWFEVNRRDLPWRSADRSPWGVLVSEVMLQQTPVNRVVPAWNSWMGRWPAPVDVAGATPADVVRQWAGLGYPRRALRLHACASVLLDRHGGMVPQADAELRALPGIGEYTAAAVRAFAFDQRSVVLDTNVRRVLARLVAGQPQPPPGLTNDERQAAESLVPVGGAAAARWSAAVMELGALVCTATSPRCDECPVAQRCAWVRDGRPPVTRKRRAQRFAGTDRQVRGRIMALLRRVPGGVDRAEIDRLWSDGQQLERALQALVADGLVESGDGRHFRLPGEG